MFLFTFLFNFFPFLLTFYFPINFLFLSYFFAFPLSLHFPCLSPSTSFVLFLSSSLFLSLFPFLCSFTFTSLLIVFFHLPLLLPFLSIFLSSFLFLSHFPVYFSIHFLSYFLFAFLFSCLSNVILHLFSVSFISSMKETFLCVILSHHPLVSSLSLHGAKACTMTHPLPVLPAVSSFSFLSSTLLCRFSSHFSCSSCLISYLSTYWFPPLSVVISVITISFIFYLFYRGSTPRSLHDECIVPSHSLFLSPVLSIISSFHTLCAINHCLFLFFWVILILLLITFLCHFYLTPISHLHFHSFTLSLIWSVKLKFTPLSGGGTVCLLLC